MGLVSEQCLYSLNYCMSELEVLLACQDYVLGVIPWSPLSGRLLGGELAKIGKGRRASDDYEEENRKEARQSKIVGSFLQRDG